MPGIFISHSSKDKPFVYRLAIDLLNRGISVWLDAWELELGDSLMDRIYQGIDDSTYFIVVISPASIESGWVNKELNAGLAKEDQLGRRFIIPIKVADCQLPLKIADRLYADFSKSYLAALETLVTQLKRWGLDMLRIPPERLLIPMSFSKGVYLATVPLRTRINAILPSLPSGFHFESQQFLVAPDPSYQLLRDRMLTRMENLQKDRWYSPEFEQRFSQDYEWVLMREAYLQQGICLIVNEMAVAHAPTGSDFVDACHWYGRIIRSSLLYSLWSMQDPNLPDVSDYGGDQDLGPLLTAKSAARFFGVNDVTRVDIGPKTKNGFYPTFSAWVDNDADFIQEWRRSGVFYPMELLYACDGECVTKFIIPQMVNQHVKGIDVPLSFDFKNYLIGLA